jgi:dTDP-4-dehydrorhamnose 3,5-epimerase
LEVTKLSLDGLLLLRPRLFRDPRGYVRELFNEPRFREAGIDCRFLQDSHTRSAYGTLRGLHYQPSPGQARLVSVTRGRVFYVALDIRPSSPTFGHWYGVSLDGEEGAQLFVPVGFAHGFCVTSEAADVGFKASSVSDLKTELAIAWDDPELGVTWPLAEPVLSDRDRRAESFADFAKRARAGAV